MEPLGTYDVAVIGAGVAGIVAAIRSAREGASTVLLEASSFLGGLVTGGRLTKPSGVINGGVFAELLERCVELGAADREIRRSYWGAYTGSFDSETMQRAIVEALDDAGVEVLFRVPVVAAMVDDHRIREVVVQGKSGRRSVSAAVFVDSSGDGDLATLAGVSSEIGRASDHRVQPMTAYVRVVNVDLPRFVDDCRAHPDDITDLVLPDGPGRMNQDYVLNFLATGFRKRIAQARSEGFEWIIPKDQITFKSGLIPGELNLNVTRFHGDGLDDRVLSRAEIVLRQQAYCAFDFLRRYVRGFEDAIFLEVAPKLGVRETRRIKGRYLLTEADVRGGVRLPDSIGLCNAPISAHDPEGDKTILEGVGRGYTIPLGCLQPLGVSGCFVAGRCISVDEVAFASTRNVPACATTGEAAGVAAALCACTLVDTNNVPIDQIQMRLKDCGVLLGLDNEELAG
jgi:hypothetical protein